MVVKYCVVPSCGNKSSNCSKIFLRVPDNIEARSTWNFAINSALEEMNADLLYFTNKKTHLFCCEDHFNLKEDIENWVQYKTIGRNMRIKEGVVPHRNLMTNETPSDVPVSQLSDSERKRKQLVLENFEKSKPKKIILEEPMSSVICTEYMVAIPQLSESEIKLEDPLEDPVHQGYGKCKETSASNKSRSTVDNKNVGVNTDPIKRCSSTEYMVAIPRLNESAIILEDPVPQEYLENKETSTKNKSKAIESEINLLEDLLKDPIPQEFVEKEGMSANNKSREIKSEIKLENMLEDPVPQEYVEYEETFASNQLTAIKSEIKLEDLEDPVPDAYVEYGDTSKSNKSKAIESKIKLEDLLEEPYGNTVPQEYVEETTNSDNEFLLKDHLLN